ncbi:MAG: LysR family transcriptional regulator, partial [Gammaproteobacteria bacterium]|nr:LysR family transcriptional regulator [Gammaproteobacteria bacterium]
VHIKLELTDRFIDLVEDRIDLAIRIGHLEESSMVARKIGEISMMVCAAPEFLLSHGLPKSPQELADKPCVLDSNYPGGNQWQLKTAQGQKTISVNGYISVNNARAACNLVLQGKGIGLLPSFVVNECIRRGELINILETNTPDSIGIYAVYLHRKHLSQKVRKMLDLLVNSIH